MMIKPAGSLLLVGATAVMYGALTACASSSTGPSAAQAQLSSIEAVTKSAEASPSTSALSGPTINPADVDVCALLSQADANSAAHAEQFDSFQDPSTVYRLTIAKQPGTATTSSCKFSIKESQGDAEGSTVFRVESAATFSSYANGKKIPGLGDDAYDGGDSPVVRVGTVMIEPVQDSFPDELTVDLLRTMVPKLK